jgi:CheY-like chemotaxis protein
MVGFPSRGKRLILLAAAFCCTLAGQNTLTLQQVGARNPSAGYLPSHLNEQVVVQGTVNTPLLNFTDHKLLAIDDGSYGAVLRVTPGDEVLDRYRPGDDVQVQGTVAAFAGMPVIVPSAVVRVGRKPAPAPIDVPFADLVGFRHLGRLVRTELRARESGDSGNGVYFWVASDEPFLVYMPRSAAPAGLAQFARASLRVTGIAYQYASQAPYDHHFQILVHDPAEIIPVQASWMPPPVALAVAIALVLLIGFLLWSREHRVRKQRERLRNTYHLGEEILASPSAESIRKRLGDSLPEILNVTRVQLYVHNRAAKVLESIAAEGGEPVSFQLGLPTAEAASGAVACFQYKRALAIPDVAESPFPVIKDDRGRLPRTMLFLPLMVQGEPVGVLELARHDRVRAFTDDDQELAQHLANQAAVAIRLFDQRSVQEQLFRTEKLAAVGRLISGVVNELRNPLSSIEDLANAALHKSFSPSAERELLAIATSARKASDIVARLVSFAAAEQIEARPVALGPLLRNLIEFREGDWKASGIRVRDLITHEPLFVLGSQGQLEQVFLNLLVHAEQSLAEASQKLITIRTSILAKRLLVEIAFTGPPVSQKAGETAAVLGVTRSVIAGHGGEVRLIEKSNADPRFEVDLPITAKERVGPAAIAAAAQGHTYDSSRSMTALVIDNEESSHRQLLALLSARGFRVVPVDNADTGLELAQRMRFDLAFCSVHAPGLNWVELSERMYSRVGGFVLVSDRHDAELAADFEGERRFVLPRPIQEVELERVLRALEPSLPAIKDGAA